MAKELDVSTIYEELDKLITEKMVVHDNLPTDLETLELISLNDLHIGDPKTDELAFHKFIKYVLEKPNRYLVYIGDNMNNAIKTSVSNCYDETMKPRDQKCG